MQLPEPAAAGLIRVATPRTAAPGARSTAAAAPTASTLMPMAASPERVVELREPQDVAAVERRLAGDEDGERDRVRRLGGLAVPHAAPVPGAGDGHGRRARSEMAVGLLRPRRSRTRGRTRRRSRSSAALPSPRGRAIGRRSAGRWRHRRSGRASLRRTGRRRPRPRRCSRSVGSRGWCPSRTARLRRRGRRRSDRSCGGGRDLRA